MAEAREQVAERKSESQRTGATHKGAEPKFAPPLTPNGPNETESGVILPRAPVSPGTGGLKGGPGYSGMSSSGPSVDEFNRNAGAEAQKAAVEAVEAEQEAAQEAQKKEVEAQKKAVEEQEKWADEAIKGRASGSLDDETKKAFDMTKEEIESRAGKPGGGRYDKQRGER
jgi:hypothetical protein